FAAASPLRVAAASSSSLPFAPRFTCCARPPNNTPSPPRRWQRHVVAVAAAFVSVATALRGAPAAAKELRYDGRQELGSSERVVSLALTAGTFAALGVWAWKQNRRDDELEEVRIREEVERLEELRQEFVDVEDDEGAMDDEDLLASLRERLGEDGRRSDADADSDADSDADPDAPEGDAAAGNSATAVIDKPDADAPPSDSLDMLKRMWDATDDDPKRDDKPSPT
ncbi:unnamed protein product, partial [Agarophyton chilense]